MSWFDEVLYRGGATFARLLPQAVGTGLTSAISSSAVRVLPERRFVIERRLRRVCGSRLADEELAQLVRASFRSYARYWYESARICNYTDAQMQNSFTVEGFEYVQAALDTGIAPILALPHLGGWELAGAWMARIAGYPVMSVVEPPNNQRLFAWMLAQRQHLGIEVVPLGANAAAKLIKSLRNQQVVCLLADRQVGQGGVEVEFFGEKTLLPAGPAFIALRTGAPLLPVAVYQQGGQQQHFGHLVARRKGFAVKKAPPQHTGVVLPPLTVERRGRLRADVVRVTQDLALHLEQLIRAAPEQWHLAQPNWPSDHEALLKFRQKKRFAKKAVSNCSSR